MKIDTVNQMQSTNLYRGKTSEKSNKAVTNSKMGQTANQEAVNLELSAQSSKIQADRENKKSLAQQLKEYEDSLKKNEYQNMWEQEKTNADASAKAMDEMTKAMKIFRNISKGNHVPPQDEKFLMEYNNKMYMAAKLMAQISKEKNRKNVKSELEDEEEKSQKQQEEQLTQADAGVDAVQPQEEQAAASSDSAD